MRTYEAMFLFDPSVGADPTKVQQEVERLMQRAGAEIIMSDKWEERKLAYEIKGRKRGCYVLTFFRADQDKITPLERDAKLSESILRVLILKADYMTEEDMKKTYITRSQPAVGGLGEDRDWRPGGRPARRTDGRPADARPAERAAPVTTEAAPQAASADAPDAAASDTPEPAASTTAATEPEPDQGLNQPE